MVDFRHARRAGILLHLTSLPSARFDDDCLRWLDFMHEAGLSVWQMLPLVIPDAHGSPYQSRSAFAANPRLLPANDQPVAQSDLDEYCAKHADWLDDYAIFEVLRRRFGSQSWTDWPDAYRHRDEKTLRETRASAQVEIHHIFDQQYRLDRAWQRIRTHAQGLGIHLFGDVPIFIAHDSADTWSRPDCFLLDDAGQPTYVTGVPPDYFAEFGQRWGNPHYHWERMREDGFSWWLARMQRQFELFDLVRIDHFRGLVAVWMIEASCDTAVDGHWEATPGDRLLSVLKQRFPEMPIVAEDLGVITEEVRQLKRKYELPGMSVLQFAFDHFEDNPHKPANITEQCIAYTGTHDNDTCVGWFNTLQPHERNFVFEILRAAPTEAIAPLMIETAMHSRAALAVAPLQDFLGLDSSARMNTPGVTDGNWRWRFSWDMLDNGLAKDINKMVQASGRLHAG